MKTSKLMIALLLLGAFGTSSAWADRHHGHVRLGVEIGPYWGPLYYPQPYYYPPSYYYPPTVIERPVPQVYIQQQAVPVEPSAAPTAAPTGYWYYCAPAKGYYPYVKTCPSGWQKVAPQPTDQP